MAPGGRGLPRNRLRVPNNRLILTAAVFLLCVTAATAGAGTETASPCAAARLSGSFTVIAGSAGAGNIVYTLTLRNRSGATCWISGLPHVTLLGKTGRALPTHVVPAQPGTATAALIILSPGQRARATARFSPDVPDPGEQTMGQCEPTAHRLRVRPNGGGALSVPVVPPTPVCEHGTMQFSLYRHA